MSAADPHLPSLRQELSIIRDGLHGSWMIYDPLRGKFHRLGHAAVTVLSYWKAERADALLERIQRQAPELRFDREALEDLTAFLLKQKLATPEDGAQAEALANEEAAQRKPWHEQLIHKYLFFRIPLWQPQNFLNRWGGTVSKAFHPATAWAFAAIGLIGTFFALRQWEQFVSTFLYFFTFQGFLFYAASLIAIKALHELGHAFAAHHFGARVPTIGLAFLVMFPILYTDTTDAWRISDRRSRILISGAGIITELCIAALSIFLWSFLPDGVFRSIAFFAATTSWVMSLAVNLNPWMRFDGYYIFSDLFGTENLQERGFAVGRDTMRKTLFGLSDPTAEQTTARARFGFTAYAWSTWVYRFFLFIGIAILVHHLFPKAIGIVLFVVEIGIFIALPISRELRVWWSEKMTILNNSRGRVTLLIVSALLIAFLFPWQRTITAPALIRPVTQSEIFPMSAARVLDVPVRNGEQVIAQQVLAVLHSDELEYRLAIAKLNLALAEAQWNRQAASTEDRQLRNIWRDRLSESRAELIATEKEVDRLTIRAPHAGIISDVPLGFVAGREIGRADRLMRIVDPSRVELIALPREVDAARLQAGASFTFISDQLGAAKQKGQINLISPTAEQEITAKELTVIGGGALAVTENMAGELIADIPVFRVQGHVEGFTQSRLDRGVVKLRATPTSPAKSVWKNVMKVLLRETDF
ncbi:HlyD family efflux transporter periplasmic adaptor subunit [Litorimonas sp. RW-G-Af-16]|uniref:HlyD family efflux transporter periplasmic adaptor subunit n=1 Tax=Litorimonas sp. RW-G-Af-16 TaxID=3241168 RepID=UPI00390C7437